MKDLKKKINKLKDEDLKAALKKDLKKKTKKIIIK